VIKENTKDKKIEIKFCIEKSRLLEIAKFFKPKILTAANVGIERRNEIFAESYLLNLKILAAVIVIPDLLTPGIKEKICNIPIIIADLIVKLLSILFSILNLSLT
tara:strand:+ start:875 stop:1189 length:315 start_codon:yes stop_codon:yes gene_type:complete